MAKRKTPKEKTTLNKIEIEGAKVEIHPKAHALLDHLNRINHYLASCIVSWYELHMEPQGKSVHELHSAELDLINVYKKIAPELKKGDEKILDQIDQKISPEAIAEAKENEDKAVTEQEA
jgi:hypothetical protein